MFQVQHTKKWNNVKHSTEKKGFVMSVQRNEYLGYGYMLDFKRARNLLIENYGEDGYTELSDEYHDSAFNNEIVEVHKCSMIEDGMNGKYTFFGKIYAKTENYEAFETQEIPEISLHDRIITEHEYYRIFGTDLGVEPKLHIITHYR